MILKSFLPRAIIALAVLQVPVWWVADAFAPIAGSFAYDSVADKLVEQIAADKDKSARHFSDLAQNFNLAWLQLTDKNKRVMASTRPPGLGESNYVIEVKGSRFVELNRPMSAGENLLIGFRCPSLDDVLLTKHIFPAQIPVGTASLALILNFIGAAVIYLVFLGDPLKRTISRLKSGQEPDENLPSYVSGEIAAISSAVKQRFSSMQDEHERSIAAARSDLSGVFAKEVEERFLHRLSKDVLALDSSDAICNIVINSVKDEFIGLIKGAFGIEFGAQLQYRIISDWGLNDEQKKVIANFGGSRFTSLIKKVNSVVFLSGDELADKKFEQLIQDLGCDQCLVQPIVHNGAVRAYVCYLVATRDQANVQKLERLVKKTAEHIAPLWHIIANFEDAYRMSRHDYITGFRNRPFLEDVLSSMTALAEEGKETFLLAFEADNFRVILNSYGPRTVDKLIQQMGQQLLLGLENSVRFKKASSKIAFADYLYRVGGCRFVLILEETTLKKAVELAENVIQSVVERKDWAHGMPSWSASCAVTATNLKQIRALDSLEEALIALDYIVHRKSNAVVINSKDVPEEFMSRAESRAGGSAGPFDPVAILDKLNKGQKTGVLTVSSFSGKVFWAYLENGQTTKARLGELCGDAALVEFISTFMDGTYRLQDLSTLDYQSAEEMRSLGGAFLLQMPLPELIDFSAKARSHWVDAKVHLKTPDMIVHPTLDKKPDQIQELFHKTGKKPNKLFLQVTNNVWDMCNGRLSLEEIVERLNNCPVSLVWMAADFLMQNKMIKFSRLRVSAYTDSSEREISSSRPAAAKPSRITAEFVGAPPSCSRCHTSDPLSQRFCVHCGSEMIPAMRD